MKTRIMKGKHILTAVILFALSIAGFGQCMHTLEVHNFSSLCNGNGTSTFTTDITILFGNGNNSATLSYDLGEGEVVTEIIEDDNGDVLNQTYSFMVPTCGDYSVFLKAWTNPSGSGTQCSDPAPIISNSALPVTFGEFGLKRHASFVDIHWTTLSEINNERFEVQRSSDGFMYETIGEVDGEYNSYIKREYDYQDEIRNNGIYYYRIKQIDLDGRYSFSEVRQIIFNEDSLLIYPNPAQDYIHISSKQGGVYYMYSATRGLRTRRLELQEELSKIDVSDLPQGLYYILDEAGTRSSQFIKR